MLILVTVLCIVNVICISGLLYLRWLISRYHSILEINVRATDQNGKNLRDIVGLINKDRGELENVKYELLEFAKIIEDYLIGEEEITKRYDSPITKKDDKKTN